VIVVHVIAGNPFRRWPLDAFTTLVAALVAGGRDRRVVVTSGPSEREAAATVIEHARALLKPPDASRVLACGEFSLDELRALLDQAALFIGGDSGPLHIASTSTVPIVGVYGPTLPVRSAPWRPPQWITESVEVPDLPCRPCDQRTCTPGDFRCLTWLRPEQVASAAERALARTASAR
jgi:ADP-heptose:LPS heptosyltransferase